MKPFLCICISTYNKSNRVEELVKEILKFQSSKIAVVVVDDNSPDDTVIRLLQIKDNRLRIFQNKKNKGARRNWYETIECGDGEYILHLLDRDWLHIEYLQRIIELLESEENKIKFGYIGKFFSVVKSKEALVEYYKAGREALEKFAFTLFHPSGFLVRKNIWDEIPDKKAFFYQEEYGIYPHSYVWAILAEKYDGAIIQYPAIEMVNKVSYARYKSRFYQIYERNRPYWWTPEAHKMELEALTQYASKYMNISKSVLRNILQYRFHENLYAATIAYRGIAKDVRNARHYGVKIFYVKEDELLKINIKFIWDYFIFIVKNYSGILNIKFLWNLLKIGKQNMKDIFSYS